MMLSTEYVVVYTDANDELQDKQLHTDAPVAPAEAVTIAQGTLNRDEFVLSAFAVVPVEMV